MSLRVFSAPVLGVVILFHALEGAAQDIQVLVSNVAGRVDPVVGSGYALRPVPHVDLNIIYDPTNESFRGGVSDGRDSADHPIRVGTGDCLSSGQCGKNKEQRQLPV